MTISAQVIDTIVEWIDDNLNQPLRIDDIARHMILPVMRGIPSGTCSAFLCSTKGRVWGATCVNGS